MGTSRGAVRLRVAGESRARRLKARCPYRTGCGVGLQRRPLGVPRRGALVGGGDLEYARFVERLADDL